MSGDDVSEVCGDITRPTSAKKQRQQHSHSPPTLPKTVTTVGAFCPAKVKTESFCTPAPVMKLETNFSEGNRGQQLPATHYVSPEYKVTPMRDEKRKGVWVTGIAIMIEDTKKSKIINNNISEAIGGYVDRVEEKRNWVTKTYGEHFWYGDTQLLEALKELRMQLLCVTVRVDILDEKTIPRAFACMHTEGAVTWFKSFVAMFGKTYELEVHCNLTTNR